MRKAAGFTPDGVLVQPMVSGVAECFAGIIDDPLYGPAIVFGLGGIFVEVLRETVTEMAPLTTDDALRMIQRVKGAQILTGARGRPPGDVAALADCLVNLGRFAVGQCRALPRARSQSHHRQAERRGRGRGRYRDRAHRRQSSGEHAMSYQDLIYSVPTRSRPSRSTGRTA